MHTKIETSRYNVKDEFHIKSMTVQCMNSKESEDFFSGWTVGKYYTLVNGWGDNHMQFLSNMKNVFAPWDAGSFQNFVETTHAHT